MSYEDTWSRIAQVGMAGLGWTPDTVYSCDMSDILLAWEGKKWLETPPDKPPTNGGALASPEAFRAATWKRRTR